MAWKITPDFLSSTFVFFWLSFFGFSLPLTAYAEYDTARLAQAGGQYVAASQSLWHLQNSECSKFVRGNYGYRATLPEVEKHFRPSDRLELLQYMGSFEWQIKNQRMYYTINSALNSKEFKNLSSEERCIKIYSLYYQIFVQSKENWEYAVQYFSK